MHIFRLKLTQSLSKHMISITPNLYTAQKRNFPLAISSVNVTNVTVDLVTFAGVILNGKLLFLCSDISAKKTKRAWRTK